MCLHIGKDSVREGPLCGAKRRGRKQGPACREARASSRAHCLKILPIVTSACARFAFTLRSVERSESTCEP
eukprot:984914-Pleurochrysis_carterae.AAC.1